MDDKAGRTEFLIWQGDNAATAVSFAGAYLVPTGCQHGCTEAQITREQYDQKDHKFTEGRISLKGSRVPRGDACKADNLLRLSDSFPIAVVEAKAETEAAEVGLAQAKRFDEETLALS